MSNYFVPTNGTKAWKVLLADPEKQWKEGYSGYELAQCWEGSEDFPRCVKSVFKQSKYSLFHNVKILYGFPEYKVSLPGGFTSSQNDLYLLAKSNDELITIMIEGKVSEPFGETVDAWKGKNPSDGKRIRLDYLLGLLNLNEENVLRSRYQLLHRTASAIIEANNVNANNALMLVHSFSETGKWFEDYAEFVKLFHLAPKKDEITGPVQLNGVNLFFSWVSGVKSQQSDQNYSIKKTLNNGSHTVELWSTKRLQFEPKNWMKEMRNDLRETLKQLTSMKNGTLYCKFCTIENNSYFDVENVLLYNVGSGSFSHLSNHHILIERSFEKIPSINTASTHKHYHLYNYTNEEYIELYWKKGNTLVNWEGLRLPTLKDKPHEYWYAMKKLKLTTKLERLHKNTNFGIQLNVGVPKGRKVNLTGICKPLIDGVISALHHYSGPDINEMAARLANLLGKDKNEIIDLLLGQHATILEALEVIRKFQKRV